MVVPLLLPIGLAVAGAAGGATAVHLHHRGKRDQIEDALNEAMNELPADKRAKIQGMLDENVQKSMAHRAEIRKRQEEHAAAVQAHVEAKQAESGKKAKEKLAPTKVKGLEKQGLVTPMEALGGW